MNDFEFGDTVDVTIRNVTFDTERSHGIVTIRDEHGIPYTMPGQAAITPARQDDGEEEPADGDARLLQSRIDNAIASIDRMIANGEIDAWQGYWLRRTLDPVPPSWPPQPGDVWDDGTPFNGSAWFAQVVLEGPEARVVMVPTQRDYDDRDEVTPEEWLAEYGETHPVSLVYRRDDDTADTPTPVTADADMAEELL